MKQLRIFIFLLAIVYLVLALAYAPWSRGGDTRSGVYNWDVYGYSFYLSGILHGDLWETKYLDEIDTLYRPCNEVMAYGRFAVEGSQRQVFKYTIGNAYFYAPFYFGAHVVNKAFLGYRADGYSKPYSVGLTLGWIFWSLWGLYLLGLFLLRYFSVFATLSTLFCIGLGTNYCAYTVQIIGMNHIPLFFCAALCLLAGDAWAKTGQAKDLSLLALGLGLSVVLRPTELLLVLALPMVLMRLAKYQSNNWANVWAFLALRWRQILLAVGVGLLTVFPQLLYWYLAAGKWVHYSYQGEYFDFAKPHIFEGLFSYQKGLFVYTPIIGLAVLGLPFLIRRAPLLGFWLLLYLSANIYVILSWTAWTYGGSFGARSMIQSFAFWALPMAALFDAAWHFLKNLRCRFCAWLLGLTLSIIPLSLVALQQLQTAQYHWSIIHWENMRKESYWFVFCKLHYTQEELDHLHWLYN